MTGSGNKNAPPGLGCLCAEGVWKGIKSLLTGLPLGAGGCGIRDFLWVRREDTHFLFKMLKYTAV